MRPDVESKSCGATRLHSSDHQPGWLAEWGPRVAGNLAVLLDRVLGPHAQQRFGILMYHRTAYPVADVAAPTINVTPDQFRRQLAGLQQRGFEFWPLQRVLAAAAAGQVVPEHVVVVTFDDGFECVFQQAVPILRELRVPATIFVATAYLDTDEPFPFDHWALANRDRLPVECYRPLRSEQCAELAADPLFEIGAHTHTHCDFRGRSEDLRRDMVACLAVLRERFGFERPTFAFPYGTPHLGYAAPELVAAVRAAGVCCGLTTQSALVDPATDPFTWGRLNVFAWDTATTLAARLHGWYSWAPRQKRLLLEWTRRLRRMVYAPRRALQDTRDLDSFELDAVETDLPPVAVSGGAFRTEPSDVPAPGAGALRPTARPLISVIVPTFNRAHWLDEALESLRRQQTDGLFDFELIVVDNASTDGTAAVVLDLTQQAPLLVRYLWQETPGDAPTRNAGLRAARGDWYAFFDDDQLAEPRWLAELFRAARATGAPIVGGPVHLDLTAAELERLGPICRKSLREIAFYSYLRPYRPRHLPGTGNALVARRVFDTIGGFDESMTRGGSDSDFFLRARAAGYALWYTPHAGIRHRIPAERLTPEHFRWDALSGGAGHAAHFDHQVRGTGALVAICALRLAHALCVTVPLLAWAHLRRDPGQMLGRRTQLWRAEGYLRKTLAVLAPGRFPQREFFESLEFRRGRTAGAKPDLHPVVSPQEPPVLEPLAAGGGGER